MLGNLQECEGTQDFLSPWAQHCPEIWAVAPALPFQRIGILEMEFPPDPPDCSGVLCVVPVPVQEEAEARQLLRSRYFIWRQGKQWCSQAPALPEEVFAIQIHRKSGRRAWRLCRMLLPNSELNISCAAL